MSTTCAWTMDELRHLAQLVGPSRIDIRLTVDADAGCDDPATVAIAHGNIFCDSRDGYTLTRVTPETLSVLESSIRDLAAVDDLAPRFHAAALFACRVRNARLDPALLAALRHDPQVRSLFEACGPASP